MKWDKHQHYRDNDIVSHNEQNTEVKYYMSLVGGALAAALLRPENIGNNPSVSPAYWSLIEAGIE